MIHIATDLHKCKVYDVSIRHSYFLWLVHKTVCVFVYTVDGDSVTQEVPCGETVSFNVTFGILTSLVNVSAVYFL